MELEQLVVDGTPFLVRKGRLGRWDRNILLGCKRAYGIDHGGTVLDVGANIGGFTCQVARNASHVYAFEPCEENYRVLQANVRYQGLKNVTLCKVAAGPGDGRKVALDTSPDNAGRWGQHTGGDRKWTEGDVAETWNLRQILGLTGDVDFCKCDCEGGEYPLFLEAADESLLRIGRAVIEVHTVPGHEHMQVVERFRRLHYWTDIAPSDAETALMLRVVREGLLTKREQRLAQIKRMRRG